MRLTSLCYIEKDNCYLMLHRVKKKVDVNKGKWVGIGGGFDDGESPHECAVREIYEETGLKAVNPRLRGIVTFVSDKWENEQMFLFTVTEFSGEIKECDEGDLAWVEKDKVKELNIWEGDKIFLEMLEKREDFFTLKFVYEGDRLASYNLEQ